MITTIPKEKIQKIKVYCNSKRQSMQAVKKELNCQYIINGSLYNMNSFTPACHLTSGGKVLSELANPFGFAARDNELVFSYGNDVRYPEFIGCAFSVLVRDGKAAVTEEESNRRGFSWRSAIGVKPDGGAVLFCEQANRSLLAVARELMSAGCAAAINLDGGGSSQCDFNGPALFSSRIVHHFICLWTV